MKSRKRNLEANFASSANNMALFTFSVRNFGRGRGATKGQWRSRGLSARALFATFLLFFAWQSAAAPLEAANLHSIIICDTRAENISSSVEADLNRVRSEMHRVAYYTKMNIREKLFTGRELNEGIVEWLRSVKVGEGDLIFLFFSGHGYRTDSKGENIWPNLYLTASNRGVDFAHLVKIVSEKNPRLLIAIADCCNNIYPEAFAPPLLEERSYASSFRLPSVVKSYKKLFLETRGVIVASSSLPGQYSWGTKFGGLFTLALFESLKVEVNTNAPDWHVLFTKAATSVVDRDVGQSPQYELSIDM